MSPYSWYVIGLVTSAFVSFVTIVKGRDKESPKLDMILTSAVNVSLWLCLINANDKSYSRITHVIAFVLIIASYCAMIQYYKKFLNRKAYIINLVLINLIFVYLITAFFGSCYAVTDEVKRLFENVAWLYQSIYHLNYYFTLAFPRYFTGMSYNSESLIQSVFGILFFGTIILDWIKTFYNKLVKYKANDSGNESG